jgi:hypothetical protein
VLSYHCFSNAAGAQHGAASAKEPVVCVVGLGVREPFGAAQLCLPAGQRMTAARSPDCGRIAV